LHEHLLLIAYDELSEHAQSLGARSGIVSVSLDERNQVCFDLIHEVILRF
jgi:hypothetical protein